MNNYKYRALCFNSYQLQQNLNRTKWLAELQAQLTYKDYKNKYLLKEIYELSYQNSKLKNQLKEHQYKKINASQIKNINLKREPQRNTILMPGAIYQRSCFEPQRKTPHPQQSMRRSISRQQKLTKDVYLTPQNINKDNHNFQINYSANDKKPNKNVQTNEQNQKKQILSKNIQKNNINEKIIQQSIYFEIDNVKAKTEINQLNDSKIDNEVMVRSQWIQDKRKDSSRRNKFMSVVSISSKKASLVK